MPANSSARTIPRNDPWTVLSTKRIGTSGCQDPSIVNRNRQSSIGLAFLLISSPLLFGFVKIGSDARWQSLPVPYKINILGLPSSTNGSEFNAVQKAFDTWQNISSSAIAFTYQGTTTIESGGSDGTNVVSFRDEDYPFPSGVIAITLSTSSSGHFTDADILFNPALTFQPAEPTTPSIFKPSPLTRLGTSWDWTTQPLCQPP
jgi:hypothetical protein